MSLVKAAVLSCSGQLKVHALLVNGTITSGNSTGPFKFRKVVFPQEADLENDKTCILQTETQNKEKKNNDIQYSPSLYII